MQSVSKCTAVLIGIFAVVPTLIFFTFIITQALVVANGGQPLGTQQILLAALSGLGIAAVIFFFVFAACRQRRAE